MAAETKEAKELCPTSDVFRIGAYALLRRNRQLSVFQCSYYGQRRRGDQALGSDTALPHVTHKDGIQSEFELDKRIELRMRNYTLQRNLDF